MYHTSAGSRLLTLNLGSFATATVQRRTELLPCYKYMVFIWPCSCPRRSSMGFVRKVGSTPSFISVSTHPPLAQWCELVVRLIIKAENLAQRMFYVLAGALSVSLAGMLTVWALHTSFALSCMYGHPKRHEADSPFSHCQSGGHRFPYMSRDSGSSAYMAVRHWFHYLSWLLTLYRSFWVSPLS